ncbi:MAG: LysE family translocator [Spirochaetota bacterium]
MSVLAILSSGLSLGLTAGLSPGPLLALVMSETIKYGKKEGIKVSFAPIMTDAPIMIIAMLMVSMISNFKMIPGIIALLGAALLVYMGYETITYSGNNAAEEIQSPPASLKKGFLVNMLSPYPYLFWISVGAPLTLRAYQQSSLHAVVWIAAFYITLIGSKIIIAILVERSRRVISSAIFTWIMRFLGVIMFLFAILFIREGYIIFKNF